MSSIETQPRSVSQTEQWEKCGYRFYLQRVEKVQERPAAWSFQGTAFHSAAEKFEKEYRIPSEEEMVQLFSDQYSKMVNGAMYKEPDLGRWMTAMKKPTGQDIEDRYKLGQQQVRDYVRWSTENQPQIWTDGDDLWDGYDISDAPRHDLTVGLELYFKVELGGIAVRGYIDQIVEDPEEPGQYIVRDLKTGSMKSPFQLETYKVAVEKALGLEVNKGDWWLGSKGTLSPKKGLDLSVVTEDQVAERYVAMDQGVKAGRFEPNPGYDCGFCSVNHACRFSRVR